MGKVIGVDRGGDGWVAGGDVDRAAGEGVLEDAEQGKVVVWIRGRVGGEEFRRVVDILRAGAACEVQFLRRGFVWIEEFLKDELVLLAKTWFFTSAGWGFG